jgi:hypothetical protein
MAALPPVPGVCKVTMTFLCSGRNFGDSFYIAHPAEEPWSVLDLEDVAAECFSVWGTELMPLYSPTCSLVLCTALDLSDDVGRVGTFSGSTPGGSTDTHPLSLNAVAHITFQVARRYRGGRPGINISGRVFEQLADERTFNSSDATSLLSAFSDFMVTILGALGGGIFQAAVSYFTGGAVRISPLVLPVTGMEIQERVCTLRKRLGKSIAEIFG